MALSSSVGPVAPVLDRLQQAGTPAGSSVDNDRAVSRILAAKGLCG